MDTEKVYSLSDLRAWDPGLPAFAVIGKPIAHSLSPKMHNAAFKALREHFPNLSGKCYFRFEIAPEMLAEAIPLFFEKNFLGLNLTIPHKVEVLPLLKKISDESAIIGAANTLVREDSLGGWRGENTDGRGFSRAVETELKLHLAGTHIVLLGAGGAARAIAARALTEGCAGLSLVNRSRERAEALVANLKQHFSSFPGTIEILDSHALKTLPLQRPLIVNATSLGLKPDDSPPFPPELIPPGSSVYDTTYGNHTSALIQAAQERGCLVADGRSMLAWQGAIAFEIWNGAPAERVAPIMQNALRH